ncbi:MAG: hypothetical protein HKM04_06210 [Legionellales bacterium]|nr:hypothetical protein [Legionellales bacterium]
MKNNISIQTLNQFHDFAPAKKYLNRHIGNEQFTQKHLEDLLHDAVGNDAIQAYRHLLEYFKDFQDLSIDQAKKSVSSDDKTLLHRAVLTQNSAIYQELLHEDRVNPFIRDHDRHSAADYAYQQAVKHPNEQTLKMLQLAVDNHTVIDVTWLALPEDIKIENALMIGHIVQKNSTKNHIFDLESMQNAIQSEVWKNEDHQVIANRIAQFQLASPETELNNVNQVLATFSDLLPEPDIIKNVSIKESGEYDVDLSENNNADFTQINLNLLDSSHLTQAEFIKQVETLQKRLKLLQQNFLTISARRPTFEVNANSIHRIKNFSLILIGITFTLVLIYNLGLGFAAMIGVSPTYGDCISYDGYAPDGDPMCVEREKLGTVFDDNDWDNMKKAFAYVNIVFGAVVGLATISYCGAEPAAKVSETISEIREDFRQISTVENVEQALHTLLDELVQTLPEFGDLISSIPKFEEGLYAEIKLETAPKRLEAVSNVLKSQADDLLTQSRDLIFSPTLRNIGFLKAPTYVPLKNEKTPLLGADANNKFVIN